MLELQSRLQGVLSPPREVPRQVGVEVVAPERISDLAAARREIDIAAHLLQARWNICELEVRGLKRVAKLCVELADVLPAVRKVAGGHVAERMRVGDPIRG